MPDEADAAEANIAIEAKAHEADKAVVVDTTNKANVAKKANIIGKIFASNKAILINKVIAVHEAILINKDVFNGMVEAKGHG